MNSGRRDYGFWRGSAQKLDAVDHGFWMMASRISDVDDITDIGRRGQAARLCCAVIAASVTHSAGRRCWLVCLQAQRREAHLRVTG
jgi:hypothetical protein